MSAVKNKILFFISIIFCLSENAVAQQDDSLMLRKIYNEILVNGKAYDWLSDLTKTVGGRLSGSPQAAEAVKWRVKKVEKEVPVTVRLIVGNVIRWGGGETKKGTMVNITSKNKGSPVSGSGIFVH